MEHGMHIEVPLPVGTGIVKYEDDTGHYFSITHLGNKVSGGWTGEYSLDPPPNSDVVFADVVSCGVEHEDAQQIIDHLASQGLVI